jgi:hypothetical protein
MRAYAALFIFAFTTLITFHSHASLISRGGGLIYDTVLNVTWLQDVNYAHTQYVQSGGNLGHSDGWMTWDEAVNWTSNLSYFDSVRGATYDDWRLPTMIDTGGLGANCSYNGTDCGYNAQTRDDLTGMVFSELAFMYFINLENSSFYDVFGQPQAGYGLIDDPQNSQDESLFINLINADTFWTGVEYAPDTSYAWRFYASVGDQYQNLKYANSYAWVVRDGDVASVPEPSTYLLTLIGLFGMSLLNTRRKISSHNNMQKTI